LPLFAQAEEPAPYVAERAYNNYEFGRAISLIEEFEKKNADNPLIDFARTVKHKSQQARDMAEHVEKIVIVDSIVVNRDDFMARYRLSSHLGTIQPMNELENSGATFITGDKNYRLFSIMDDDSASYLAQSSRLLDGTWDEPQRLPDVINVSGSECFPFLMPDGQTLYFASNNENSIGGYDIFISRKDIEEGEFRSAQNIGMPYNSPYDDYMLVIDEFTGYGWWATDRNQIPDSVTIYVFIPNAMRVNYDSGTEMGKARISSIAETWPDGFDHDAELSKINAIVNNLASGADDANFTFHVKKGVVYHKVSDAKTVQGRENLELYVNAEKRLHEMKAELKSQRKLYAVTSRDDEKQMLANKLMQLEEKVKKCASELDYYGNEVRKAELK
ncbi:MAG: PD40 domain-containing protein, partial [Muribaculaceae bacterium]|nr:PD40 domain-containing protein [Muribaculaceae bacterium]